MPGSTRHLNVLHFKIYIAVWTILLLLSLFWLLNYYNGWRTFVGVFIVVFIYGIGRFPITRGTGPNSVDAGFLDFIELSYLWLKVALGAGIISYLVQFI
jgi:hypothetical protein